MLSLPRTHGVGRRLLAGVAAALLLIPAAPGATASQNADRTKPQVAVTPGPGGVLIGPSRETGMRITGTVSDNRRVRGVTITAVGERDLVVVGSSYLYFAEADLDCEAGGRTCVWSADLPRETAEYTVFARAYDHAGNRRRSPDVQLRIITAPESAAR